MNMQDNELDDLFRAKLDNLEVEPSAQVWTNIDTKLDEKGRSKSVLPLLWIAASVIVLVTVGVLFIPRKAQNGNNPVNKVAKVTPHTEKLPDKTEPSAVPVVKPTEPENIVPVNTIAAVPHRTKKPGMIKPAEHKAPVIENTNPVNAPEQQTIAAMSPPKEEVIKPVVPDTETPLVQKTLPEKQVSLETPAAVATTPVLATTQPAATKKPAVKKHGIRNFGDLVNLVVAKVDKRKDKVIEFSDDDDDGSITGVNIGVIKIKKDK